MVQSDRLEWRPDPQTHCNPSLASCLHKRKLTSRECQHLHYSKCRIDMHILTKRIKGEIRISLISMTKRLGWRKSSFNYWKWFQPPLVPTLYHAGDTGNFDRYEDRAELEEEEASKEERDLFTNWWSHPSYISYLICFLVYLSLLHTFLSYSASLYKALSVNTNSLRFTLDVYSFGIQWKAVTLPRATEFLKFWHFVTRPQDSNFPNPVFTLFRADSARFLTVKFC